MKLGMYTLEWKFKEQEKTLLRSVCSMLQSKINPKAPHWRYREKESDKFPMNKGRYIKFNCAISMVTIFKDL